MDKQFFVVVPYSPPVLNKPGGGLFSGLFGNKSQQTINIDEKQLLQYKSLITERTGVIVSGLASLGLRAAMLSTQELVELFYEIYNPEESSEEKLADVNVLESALISTKEGENATTK
jgi:hypothetical protein